MSVLLTMLRITVVLATALAILPLLRRQSAAMRAWLLTAALASAALIPLLQMVAPAWGSPLGASVTMPAADDWSRSIVLIWAAGAAGHLVVLVAGLVRLMGVAAAADPIREGRCADLALDIAAAHRVHAPVLLLQAERETPPVTWGHVQPKILLPPAARNWDDERLRAVLLHEIAHVRRRDWAVQMFATVIRAIYWAHPLVWVVCSRLRFECERACDDAVLRSGIPGSRYAAHLLDVARSALDGRERPLAAGLAVRSTLEGRVRSMLVACLDRSPVRRPLAAFVGIVIFVIATGVAGFGSVIDRERKITIPPPKRLTLLLDGRIVDLSKEWPTYPNPRAGLVEGPGFPGGF